MGTEENVPARKRGEPEERGPLKGTRLHDAEWVGLRSVARHTDESFEFVRTCASHCLALERSRPRCTAAESGTRTNSNTVAGATRAAMHEPPARVS